MFQLIYIAIFIAKIFKIIIVLATKFNLKIKQFNIVIIFFNTFKNK